MNRNDYTRFSEKKNNVQDTIKEVENKTILISEESSVVNTTPCFAKGVVTGCEKLNVRKEANKNAEVLCIINKSDEVEIDLENSTQDFFKVITSNNIEGYCMKDYINNKDAAYVG